MRTTLLYTSFFLLFISCDTPGAHTAGNATGKQPADTTATVAKEHEVSPQIDTAALYSKAIALYIKEAYKGKPLPDTLFIGRHIEFPGITLPAVIEQGNIMLLTGEEAQKKLVYRKSLVFLNVMGWISKEDAEFLIVRFNEFRPQHNCHIYFKRQGGEQVLDSLGFEYPYGKQQKREGDFHH